MNVISFIKTYAPLLLSLHSQGTCRPRRPRALSAGVLGVWVTVLCKNPLVCYKSRFGPHVQIAQKLHSYFFAHKTSNLTYFLCKKADIVVLRTHAGHFTKAPSHHPTTRLIPPAHPPNPNPHSPPAPPSHPLLLRPSLPILPCPSLLAEEDAVILTWRPRRAS
jgi:hypothetical protein